MSGVIHCLLLLSVPKLPSQLQLKEAQYAKLRSGKSLGIHHHCFKQRVRESMFSWLITPGPSSKICCRFISVWRRLVSARSFNCKDDWRKKGEWNEKGARASSALTKNKSVFPGSSVFYSSLPSIKKHWCHETISTSRHRFDLDPRPFSPTAELCRSFN